MQRSEGQGGCDGMRKIWLRRCRSQYGANGSIEESAWAMVVLGEERTKRTEASVYERLNKAWILIRYDCSQKEEGVSSRLEGEVTYDIVSHVPLVVRSAACTGHRHRSRLSILSPEHSVYR